MRIKEILKQKGMTAKDLAARLDMSEGALSQAINKNPTLKTLTQIAEGLGVELRDLFDDVPLKETLHCPKCGTEIKVAITRVAINVVGVKEASTNQNEE